MFWRNRRQKKSPIPSDDEIKAKMPQRVISLGVRVEQLIQQRNWGESRRYIETNAELLSPEIEGIFDDLSTMPRDAGSAVLEAIEEHRQLLSRCREQGVEAAFEGYLRRFPGG